MRSTLSHLCAASPTSLPRPLKRLLRLLNPNKKEKSIEGRTPRRPAEQRGFSSKLALLEQVSKLQPAATPATTCFRKESFTGAQPQSGSGYFPGTAAELSS